MSSIFGAKESALGSTRLLDNPPPDDKKPKYERSMVKWLLDKFFPASPLKLEADRSRR